MCLITGLTHSPILSNAGTAGPPAVSSAGTEQVGVSLGYRNICSLNPCGIPICPLGLLGSVPVCKWRKSEKPHLKGKGLGERIGNDGGFQQSHPLPGLILPLPALCCTCGTWSSSFLFHWVQLWIQLWQDSRDLPTGAPYSQAAANVLYGMFVTP